MTHYRIVRLPDLQVIPLQSDAIAGGRLARDGDERMRDAERLFQLNGAGDEEDEVRGSRISTAARRLPGPESLRLVTATAPALGPLARTFCFWKGGQSRGTEFLLRGSSLRAVAPRMPAMKRSRLMRRWDEDGGAKPPLRYFGAAAVYFRSST